MWCFIAGSVLATLLFHSVENLFLIDKYAKRIAYGLAAIVVFIGIAQHGFALTKPFKVALFFIFYICFSLSFINSYNWFYSLLCFSLTKFISSL